MTTYALGAAGSAKPGEDARAITSESKVLPHSRVNFTRQQPKQGQGAEATFRRQGQVCRNETGDNYESNGDTSSGRSCAY